nr:MAG TPA: hypothetical protein [Caudoviricetes sp.]
MLLPDINKLPFEEKPKIVQEIIKELSKLRNTPYYNFYAIDDCSYAFTADTAWHTVSLIYKENNLYMADDVYIVLGGDGIRFQTVQVYSDLVTAVAAFAKEISELMEFEEETN